MTAQQQQLCRFLFMFSLFLFRFGNHARQCWECSWLGTRELCLRAQETKWGGLNSGRLHARQALHLLYYGFVPTTLDFNEKPEVLCEIAHYLNMGL